MKKALIIFGVGLTSYALGLYGGYKYGVEVGEARAALGKNPDLESIKEWEKRD